MKLVENTTCLEYHELVPDIMSVSGYHKSRQRGIVKTIGRGGNGNQVWIIYDSLPLKHRLMVDRLHGSPKQEAARVTIKEAFVIDELARTFFHDHRLENGLGLPDSRKELYLQAASMLNTINYFVNENLIRRQFASKTEFWKAVTSYIETEKIDLPTSYCKLLVKLKEYNQGEGKNYGILINRNFCNDYSEKVDDEMRGWLNATYASPANPITDLPYLLELYNQEAERRDKKQLSSIGTLYRLLVKPENERQWMGPRQGYLKLQQKYGYRLRTKMPTMRDSLWYGDGTKLNFFDRDGKLKAAYTVYEVYDAFSECFLGYSITESENFQGQYLAMKMALKFSGQKPFELRYDNQGGHKKLQSSQFLEKLAHLNIATRPYNPQSKTIESAFGRFQSHYMARHWFFTGQNITTKKTSSHANMEFICANLQNLPTIEQVEEIYVADRNEWMAAKHPKAGISRIEMYRQSQNPEAKEVQMWDMVDLFWLTTPKPITYRDSIKITLNKLTYEYEVLRDQLPDADFRRRYTHERFFVKYDPDDMSFILLYQQSVAGLQFVARADERIHVQRNVQEQVPGEMKKIRRLNDYQKQEISEVKLQIEQLMIQHGTNAEAFGLNSAQVPGQKSRKHKTASIGKVYKEESMADLVEVLSPTQVATDPDQWMNKM